MSRIAAVLLAAGASQRFGAPNKLLAGFDGKAIVLRVLDVLERAGVPEIVVVTGWDAASVEQALSGRQVRFAHNPDWATGMGSSISTGIAALGSDIAGAMIVPGDMPLLAADEIAQLVAQFAAVGAARVVYPVTGEGEQRSPVLWPRRFFADLRTLDPSKGARQVLARLAPADCLGVPVSDEGTLIDIDTPEALAAATAPKRLD